MGSRLAGTLRIRPIHVTTAFVVSLAAIANLAWATASTTTGPWFPQDVSAQVYSMSLVTAAVLALGVAAVGASRAGRMDREIRAIALRVAAARDGGPVATNKGVTVDPGQVRSPIDDEIDEILESVGSSPGDPIGVSEPSGHDRLGPDDVPATPVASRSAASALRELRGQRTVLRDARAHVWSFAAGPLAVCLLFIGIAGAMLPGSGGFAASNYRLNTTLVLFLSYGWPFLAAWALVAVARGGAAASRISD